MAQRPTLANLDDHLKPTTDQVEEFLHRWHDPKVGAAVRRAAWEGDETKGMFDLAKVCTDAWPRYLGQQGAPDFTNVDWASLLDRQRSYATEFTRLQAQQRAQLTQHPDPEQLLRQMLHEDAQLPPFYDEQLLEAAAHVVWERGSDPLPPGENALREVLEGMDEDQSFKPYPLAEDVHYRIGRVVTGPEAAVKRTHWGTRVDRPGYEVHQTEALARSGFDELRQQHDRENVQREI